MGLHFGPVEDVFPAVYRDYNVVRHSHQRQACLFDLPGIAYISYTEMKFSKVSWGVLLILPPRSVTLPAKSTLVAFAGFRDEPIVRLVGLKNTREVHLVDLFAFEDPKKGLCGYTVHESRYDPVDCERTASSLSAIIFEFEGIGLEWSSRFLPRSIVTPSLWYWGTMW